MNPQDPTQTPQPDPQAGAAPTPPATEPAAAPTPAPIPEPAVAPAPAPAPEPTPAPATPAPAETVTPETTPTPAVTTSPEPTPTGPMPAPATPQPAVQPGNGPKKSFVPTNLIKPLIFAGASLVVLVLVAVGVSQFLGGGVALTTYSNEDLGFSISHPDGWNVDDSRVVEDAGTIEINENTDDQEESDTKKFDASIAIEVTRVGEARAQTSEEFFEEIEDFIDQVIDLQETGEGEETANVTRNEKITVGDWEAYRVDVDISNYQDEEGQNAVASLVFIFVNEQTAISFGMEAHESDQNFYDEFDAILNSISLD